MAEAKQVLLSGIQPSGELHIGNYFGAMRQFVELQNDYDTLVSIVNYHALTTVRDAEQLRRNTLDAVIDHLAVGLDPNRVTLFVQSDVPEHAELTWIFNCLLTVPFLERSVAYKDKIAQGLTPSVGLLDYPVLMATDILMYDAAIVPVGSDQQQHVEYARDIAEKFNTTYGETFRLPKALIREEVATVPGTDGRKMSKSYHNTIPLFGSDEKIERAVMSIPTDSRAPEEPKTPDGDTLFELHKLFAGDALPEIRRGYEEGGLSYAESKRMLIERVRAFVAPLRERRATIAGDLGSVHTILKNGAERARSIAMQKMHEVREKVGLTR